MTSRLKEFYQQLIDNRKDRIQTTYNIKRDIYDWTESTRKSIADGARLSSNDAYSLFSYICKMEDDASNLLGEATINNEKFQQLFENKDFLTTLEQFILIPNRENFLVFEKVCSESAHSIDALIINSIAVASTLNISLLASQVKSDKVFYWIIKEKAFPISQTNLKLDWFTKNLIIMQMIYEEFEMELQDKTTDQIYLRLFVKQIYDILSNPFSFIKFNERHVQLAPSESSNSHSTLFQKLSLHL